VKQLSSGNRLRFPDVPKWHSLCNTRLVVMELRGLRGVRLVVVGLLMVAILAPTAVWAGAAMAEDCHGCCPEVLRAAPLPDCCVVAPDAPAPPKPVRVISTPLPLAAPVPTIVGWSQPPAPADLPVTGDPPLRPIPLLLRTSVLLI
jgi:hypothetical protein